MWHPALFRHLRGYARRCRRSAQPARGAIWRGRESTKPAPPSLIGVLVWTVPPLEPFLDHEAERGAEAGARKTEKQLSCHNQPAHVSSLLRCPGNANAPTVRGSTVGALTAGRSSRVQPICHAFDRARESASQPACRDFVGRTARSYADKRHGERAAS